MDKKGRRFADERDISSQVYEPEELAPEDREEISEELKRNIDRQTDARLKKKNSKKLEKQLKKQRRRVKKAGKKAAHDDDPELEERRETEIRDNKLIRKRVIIALVIVLLLFVVVFFAMNSDRFSVHNISNFISYGILNRDSEEKFPLDIQGESISAGNFTRMGQDICCSSDTKTMLLNNYGKTVFSAQHAFINPILTADSDKALIYNLGGTGYQIISKDGETYNAEAEGDIIVADIVNSGAYALVTRSSGYLSKLYVYNEKHEQIYAYSFADYYVTSVTLNSTGMQAVVSGLSALDGINISSLYVLDFTKDTPLYFSELENNIIYDVEYLSDRYACAVGRSASYSVNTRSGSVETYDYEGSDLTAYDINTDTNTYTLSLSHSGDGRNCNIISFNSGGKADKSFSIDERIIGLSSYKGRVALLTNSSVMLFSKDGSRLSEKELSSDPHSVVMYTGSDVYVLCTGYIDTISMR